MSDVSVINYLGNYYGQDRWPIGVDPLPVHNVDMIHEQGWLAKRVRMFK